MRSGPLGPRRASRRHGLVIPALVLALFGATPILWGQSATPTAQKIYNDAQAALDNSDWRGAISGFERIAKPDDGGGMSHSQGVIHARLAQAYAHDHKTDKALAEARLALEGLAPSDDEERALTWLAIAEAQYFDLAVTGSADSFGKALESAAAAKSAPLLRRAQVGLALCYVTVDPARATQLLDTVLAAPEFASSPDIYRAQIYDVRGRATLNLGNAREAMPYLVKAVDLSGGMRGAQVNLVQVGIRGDAAIGALLIQHADEARLYLAWTGAGHLPSNDWISGLGDPPVCNEAAGVGPKEMAVVEFSINAAGRVTGAVPIYVSRPGTLGVTFAKAVRGWSWNPERIAALPAFWRNMVRIEMRCISHPNPRGLAAPFRAETIEWLSRSGLTAEDLAPDHTYVARDDPRLEREDLAAVPALFARLQYESDHGRSMLIAQHLTAALDKAHAPAAVRALAMSLQPVDAKYFSGSAANVRMKADQVAALEHSDPKSAPTAWRTLEYAIALEGSGQFDQARPVLERVLAYPKDALGDNDPVREVAILHLSALQRRAGDIEGAEARIKAVGLTRAQCMLFDVRPVATDQFVSSKEFPDEALRWGFDGLVREAFDIDAAGHVQNVRTIIAYPPFVFRSAAEKTVAHFRYLAPVVEGGAAGCDGHSLNLSYRAVTH